MDSRIVVTPVNPGSALAPDHDPGSGAGTGVQVFYNYLNLLDSDFRRNDGNGLSASFCESVNFSSHVFFTFPIRRSSAPPSESGDGVGGKGEVYLRRLM